jgi:hypothetical protein
MKRGQASRFTRGLPMCTRVPAFGAGLLLMLGYAACPSARADSGDPGPTAISSSNPLDANAARGHGRIWIDYQNTLGDGLRISDGQIAHNGDTRIRSLTLGVEYNLTDKWTALLSLPFVSNRYSGPAPHCPTREPAQCASQPELSPPHPESRFLDDGAYHGGWQDWGLGIAYNGNVGSTLLKPSLTVHLPSHDYAFFANAALGQNLWKIEPGIDIAHQFDFSNIYYTIHYSYVFVETAIGVNVNHSRLDLELGYFVNPDLTLRAFTLSKFGKGAKAGNLIPQTQGFTNDLWYHHDQISAHNYASFGIGADYHLGDRYTVSASIQKLYWGQTVFNFTHSLDLSVSRTF